MEKNAKNKEIFINTILYCIKNNIKFKLTGIAFTNLSILLTFLSLFTSSKILEYFFCMY